PLALLSLYSTLHTLFFLFHDPPPTEIYTLSLHDALPISVNPNAKWNGLDSSRGIFGPGNPPRPPRCRRISFQSTSRTCRAVGAVDRKSTRLNSSHDQISYAVFCLKKKKKQKKQQHLHKER